MVQRHVASRTPARCRGVPKSPLQSGEKKQPPKPGGDALSWEGLGGSFPTTTSVFSSWDGSGGRRQADARGVHSLEQCYDWSFFPFI